MPKHQQELLSPRYEPGEFEWKIYEDAEKAGYYTTPGSPGEERYCIVIPPPNVTGALHMGHALNNVIQDILIRYYRMRGKASLWIPGTDHAGIATQNVVERELLDKEGKTRDDLGREEFIRQVWKWKEKFGGRIIEQLKRLGCSCDWSRTRFTLDDGLSRAVQEVFLRLYKKGLIYRGERLINWCPRCQTALAHDEAKHREIEGKLWDIKYPIKDGEDEFVVVSTTRPETMLGDTAIAVNEKDDRHRHLIGKTAILPLLNRELPIIHDEHADPEKGTGAVKITPAHDPDDFEVGNRHNLEMVNILNPDGTLNRSAGPYAGLDRFAARERVLKDLQSQGLLVSERKHNNYEVPHCYRCDTIVEPYLSKQWFVKMAPILEPAIEAVKSRKVRFIPERFAQNYLNWTEARIDWCISRQIWWGHRIPIWYCDGCPKDDEGNEYFFASIENPEKCPKCGGTSLRQDEDVLDTWFSSALWPFSTMGWPDGTDLLKNYYPTNVLVTDRGIIGFWVARMVVMGMEFMKEKPFHQVYIHGTILDEKGDIMSKSRGNGIDPIEMIEKFGADAVRFSLMLLSTEGQDIKLSPAKFEMGRNFTNKLWNASRFVLMNIAKMSPTTESEVLYEPEDRWILHSLSETISTYHESLKSYRINPAAMALRNFTWDRFCDWYLELVKKRFSGPDDISKYTACRVCAYVLDVLLRLLSPFMPFVTEELWQRLKGLCEGAPGMAESPALMLTQIPDIDSIPTDAVTYASVEEAIEIIRLIRGIRGDYNRQIADSLGPRAPLPKALVTSDDAGQIKRLSAHGEMIKLMSRVAALEIAGGLAKPMHAATKVSGALTVYVPLEGVIDFAAERDRLQNEKAKIEKNLMGRRKKLRNQDFLTKARPEVVEREKKLVADMEQELAKIEEHLKNLEE
ncbi:MAG: valine--tRNA ligase [Planctomycetota bacterium]|jgi:valyl-tRNA synthetase